ncbi:MAG: glycosyltransferase [Gemmatimonadetes bacterium]|nr:glycosyltransferase [Gemmatimonadota bacterium]
MVWSVLLWSLPWLALVGYVVVFVREPPELPPAAVGGSARPLVSVIVPARNEAHNIATCVASVVSSAYGDFEVIVVDDRSEDGTAALARAVPTGRARRVLVLDGAPLPDGWFGKQWACWQGVREARGELLLFTDADTVHGPELLARAVDAVALEDADCLTVIGRQIMESFWVRLVQPQVFMLIALRYPGMGRAPLARRRWRSAIANGQYLLFRRGSYEALGGHAAVCWEAAEDLRLAQRLVRSGGRLVARVAYADFGTRMYRGLREMVGGWSKNMIQAGLQTVPPRVRPIMPAVMFATGVSLWLLPPAALIAALAGVGGLGLLVWSAAVTGLLMLFWTAVGVQFGAPAWVGPLYPLGALVGHWILLKSWLGKGRVQWKGRSYRWDVYADVHDEAPPAVSVRVGTQ